MNETLATVDVSAFPSRRYAPVGRCIYCGTFSAKLGKEHIIPFGLAGNALVLAKASCGTCESITGGFEQSCLRTILGPFRLRVGSPTRNPKERPDKLPLTLAKLVREEPVATETILVPVQEFPLVFLGLRMRAAGILSRDDPAESDKIIDFALWTRHNEEDTKKYMGAAGSAVRLGQIKPRFFGQMVAKIAYSWAVAEFGYGNFKPLVTDFILGKTGIMNHWVGGDWEIPPPTKAAFEIKGTVREERGRKFLLVNVRLFSFFETPQYHVVVGEI